MRWLTNSLACLAPEELEGRNVPSCLAAEFPGQGVWMYSAGAWTQLTAANASQVAADDVGDVVGEFPGQGVWLFSGGAWQQITANNASSLDIGYSSGISSHESPYRIISVVAQFPGQGLWRYTRSNVLGYDTAAWQELTANNAATEAIDGNGNVVANFPGQGTWFFGTSSYAGGTSGWQRLNDADAISLAIGSAAVIPSVPSPNAVPDVVAAVFDRFSGYAWAGVSRLTVDVMGHAGDWTRLTAAVASMVGINAGGDVVAEFPMMGMWNFTDSSAALAVGWTSGWHKLTAADAALLGIDASGYVYGQFPYWGV
jgi:hypothetical protein